MIHVRNANGRELVLLRIESPSLCYGKPCSGTDLRDVRHSRVLSGFFTLAVAFGMGSAAMAQAQMPSPAAPTPSVPNAPSEATPSHAKPAATQAQAASEPRLVKAREVSVISGSRFRIGQERYQIFGIRSPRSVGGQCVMERLRGRQARAALRRIFSRGEIRIAPTGQLNPLGDKIARVWVDGQSVARRLVNARAAVARRPGESFNPWCISLRRPPA